MRKAAGTGGVMAIRVVLSIIERLAKHESVGITELSKLLGMTKARVFRHLRTLVDEGYATQDVGTDRYASLPPDTACSVTLPGQPCGSALARRVPLRGGRNARPVSWGPPGPTDAGVKGSSS